MKNNEQLNNNNIKNINTIDKDNNKNKANLIWSNSPFNKKINTYENLLYKKTFDKHISVRDKLIPEKKNINTGIILPDLKKVINTNTNDSNANNYQSLNIKKSYNSPKLNLRSLSIDKTKTLQNNNLNSITGDTTAFTNSSKKCFSPIGLGKQNYTEDYSKYRMGLLSAGSSSNSNIIIPMIPIRRPVSNFNFGGDQLWNNIENNNKNINNKNINDKDKIKDEDKNINKYLKNEENVNGEYIQKEANTNLNNINYNVYNKINIGKRNKMLKSQDMKSEGFTRNADINNLYIGMDKMITKLHKIKIEKGMMNNGIMNSLNEKFNNDYQSQIEQFKKGHLPMMFNNQIDNKKKNISLNSINNIDNKRSHSFNNRNNFH